jgi:DNA-directed RNA polymerase subunit H (RpoH/RPB5)
MDVYLSRLPTALANIDKLLQSRGFPGHPLASARVPDLFRLCKAQNSSLGKVLSVTVKKSGAELRVGWIDPVFDLAKGREVMTSAYQLHGAIAKGVQSLIVSYARLSPDAVKESLMLKNAQVMTFAQLAIQISDHVLIPRHVALSETEAESFETSRGVKRGQLPILQLDDPVTAWYDWRKGTIIRVDRPQGPYWRVVA